MFDCFVPDPMQTGECFAVEGSYIISSKLVVALERVRRDVATPCTPYGRCVMRQTHAPSGLLEGSSEGHIGWCILRPVEGEGEVHLDTLRHPISRPGSGHTHHPLAT